MEDKNFFKAVSYLTTLLKSEGGQYFAEHGFSKEAMLESILGVLEQNMSQDQKENKWSDYCQKVYESIDDVLKELIASGLIIKEKLTYYITPQGYEITDFMLDLSKNYFKDFNIFYMKDAPYRFYPGSSSQYGLN